jgi:hypothetical protein
VVVLDIRYEHRAVAQDQGVQQLLLVIPVFNDWESFATLLTCLDQALAQAGMQATVLGVDDGSTRPDRMRTLIEHSFQAIAKD